MGCDESQGCDGAGRNRIWISHLTTVWIRIQKQIYLTTPVVKKNLEQGSKINLEAFTIRIKKLGQRWHFAGFGFTGLCVMSGNRALKTIAKRTSISKRNSKVKLD